MRRRRGLWSRPRSETGWARWKDHAAQSRFGSPAKPAGSRSRTRPATATHSARRCRWESLRLSWLRSRTRWAAWSRAGLARTARSTPANRRCGGPFRRRGSRRRWRSSSKPARSCAANSAPAERSANGATRRFYASCGAVLWPGCAARLSRSSKSSWPGSCRRGRECGLLP